MQFKLKQFFNLKGRGFIRSTKLTDTEYGFSALKKYSGQKTASLFYIFIKNEEIEKSVDKKAVFVKISYGVIGDDDELIVASSSWKRPLFGPIDLISKDDFFFSLKEQKFYDKKGKVVNADFILDSLEKLHFKPTRAVLGFGLRSKLLFWKLILPALIKLVGKISSLMLRLKTGRTYSYNIFAQQFMESNKTRKEEGEKKGDAKLLNVFGYHISPLVFWVYALIHLVLFLIFRFYCVESQLISEIASNSFLTTLYAVFSLLSFEYFLKIISEERLREIVKKTSLMEYKLLNRKIKL